MNSRQTWSFNTFQPDKPVSSNSARLFYSGAALLILLLMLLGFQQFYLHGKAYPDRELAPPIRTLIILHGAGMTAWVLLFLAQPLLVVSGNRRVHMLLGRIGAGLAACIVMLGFRLGVEATRISPPGMMIWGLTPVQFMAVPIISILIFAVFVIIGVCNRRRPQVHRPMMLLATLAAIPAAVSRIGPLSALYQGTLWEALFGPFFATLVIGLCLVVLKWRLTGSLNRYFALGYATLAVSSALIMQLATTEAWDRFAGYLL